MKKSLLAVCIFSALSGAACAGQQSVSIGWAHAKVQSLDNIDGVNLKYRYEWNAPVGIIGSLTWMNGDQRQHWLAQNDIMDTRAKVDSYSLMAGPAWRINDYVSVYGLLGLDVVKVKYNSRWNNYNGPGNYSYLGTLSGSETTTNFAWGAGVQINPLPNLLLDLGYEGTRIDVDDRTFKINGFTLGVGYTF